MSVALILTLLMTPADAAKVPVHLSEVLDREIEPAWPEVGYFLRVQKAECRLRVIMTPDGDIEEVVGTACPQPFVAHSEATIRSAAWNAPQGLHESDRAWFDLTMQYSRPPSPGKQERADRVLDAHGYLHVPTDGCSVALTVHPDGAVDELATSDKPNCLLLQASEQRLPRKLVFAMDADVACSVTFDVEGERVKRVDTSSCPADYRGAAARVVERSRWSAWGSEPQTYTADITFPLR